MSENHTIPTGLKNTFLAHFITAIVIGVPYVLFPEKNAELFNFTIAEPIMWRLLGAAILSFGLGSWFGYKSTNWESVRIIVIMEVVWTILGTIITIWGILSEDFPAIAWINAIVLGAFAVLFSWYYFQSIKE